jgi:hypothetical protein
MNGLILYTTEDGQSHIQLRTKDQTVWLSQREMAELLDVSTDNIGLHLKTCMRTRIRASEKRFYQKVRELFALSSDYDKTDQATQTFSPRCKTCCSTQ